MVAGGVVTTTGAIVGEVCSVEVGSAGVGVAVGGEAAGERTGEAAGVLAVESVALWGTEGDAPGVLVSGSGWSSTPGRCAMRRYLGIDTGGSSSTSVFTSLKR